MTRTLACSLVVLVAAGAIAAGAAVAQDGDEGSRFERLLEGMLSTPEHQVSLTGLAGVFTSSPTVERITVSDGEGAWLEIEGVEVVWARTALLRRILDIDSLTAERISVLRKPAPGADAGGDVAAPPVDVIVDSFTLPEITLAAPVVGAEASLSAEGSLRMTDEELSARVAVLRLDREGRLSADLRLQPQDNVLTANLQIAEPEGGIIVEWLGLRGSPAVAVTLAGSGPLANWQAELEMQANEVRLLAGGVAVSRVDSGYRISGELAAALESIAPEEYAALVAGESRLSFNVVRGDDGSHVVEAATLRSQGVDLAASGTLTPDLVPASAEVTLNVGAAGRTKLPFAPGDVSVARLTANIGLDEGAAAAWRADIQAEDVESAFGGAGNVAVTASGQAENLTEPSERSVVFRVEGTAEAVEAADPALADALGPSLQLTANGAWSAGAPVRFENLQAILSGATASFEGTATAAEWNGRFNADVTDLQRFAALAGRTLGGSAEFQADGTLRPADAAFDLDLDGEATDLRLGIATLDPLLAGSTRLEGEIARGPDEFRFDAFALSNQAVTASLTGALAEPELDLSISASLVDLASLSERAAGRADISARMTGTSVAPRIEAEISGEEIVLMGQPLSDAVARFSGIVAGPETEGDAEISGMLDGVPIEGSARLSAAEDGGRALDDLLLSVGESRASGDLVIGADGLLAGDLAVVSPDLSQVAPLFLAEASGSLRADVTLAAEDGEQSATFSGSAADLEYEGIAIESADITGTARNLLAAPQIDGSFSVRNLTAGGLVIVAAEGTAERQGEATAFSAEAQLTDGSAMLAGRLEPRGEALALALETFSFARAGADLALTAPTTIVIENGTARFDGARFSVDGGSATLTGEAAANLDLAADFDAVPAALLNSLAPELQAEGAITGRATITGPAAAPNGAFSINWEGASVAASRNAGLGALSVSAEGTLSDGIATLTGRGTGAGGLSVEVSGTAGTAADTPLNLRIIGAVPLSLGNRTLAGRGAALEGALQLDLAVAGPASAPQFSGRVTSEGGGFIDPRTGIVLSNLSLAASVSNNRIVIDRLNARSGEGTVSGSGSIGLDPGTGFPVDVQLQVRRARYVDGTLVAAEFDADLSLTGNFTDGPVLAGSVVVDRAEITVPEQLPRDSVAVDVAHVNAPADVRETVARARETGRRGTQAGGERRGLALDLAISAPRQVFVRGRGIDAEMGGDLRLSGPVSAIVADGAFELRRGRLDIFSQRITFDRGVVTFAGDLDPILDFVGTTQSEEITVTVTITGSASDPEVEFSSIPELPQDEVLAHLIFERGIGELSPVQIARLADAAAQLSGGGGGLLNALRESTGLDDLDIVTDEEGAPALAAGRYINENVYLGVQQGTGSESTRVTIDLDITEDVKARAALSPQGNSSLGIFFEREY